MKSNYSLERRLKIGNLNKGKNLSTETIEKISWPLALLTPPCT